MKHIKPEALEVGDVIRIDPYDLEITHTRSYTTAQGETEYVLSTTSSGPWRAPYTYEPTITSH